MAGDGRVQRRSVDGALEERVGQVLNDFLDRRERGEPIGEAELLAQHPDLAADLRQHLDLLRDIEPTRHALVELLDRGILAKSSDPRFPGRLGPYQVVGLLGRGGMGVVLKAYEERLNRTVALKLLRPELTHDKTVLARFEQEAKVAAGLQHPNIVAVHAIGEENGTHFIVMEFVSGPTLAALVRKEGPLPAERVRVLFGQMLAGLKAAHEAGLVHRDIKSSNILLYGGEQLVKIADFGLARMLSAETRMTMSGSIFGTPEYMSPEQARGDENIDHRTDLYSAGVVLYEMLTGRLPFRGDSPSTVIHAILNTEPPPPRVLCASADKRLSRLALRLMAKRPADRFESAADALAALDSRRPIRVRASRRETARRARRVAIGIAVTLVAVAMLRWQDVRALLVTRPPITSVEIERRNDASTGTVLARFGDDPTPRVFVTWPPEAGPVHDVICLDIDGRGEQLVVLGSTWAVNGATLVAYDCDARERWRMNLASPRKWPEASDRVYWLCNGLTRAELDGRPGDELIVSANAVGGYPSRLSIVSPKSEEILSTFWHPGNLNTAIVVRDFFGPSKPALIVWGTNNKLDGLNEDSSGQPPSTSYDLVSVVAVLDPQEMEGIAPPFAGGLSEVPAAKPYAYAFLNAAVSLSHDAGGPIDGDGHRAVQPDEVAQVTKIQEAPQRNADGSGPFLSVDFQRETGERTITWIVDRHLRLVESLRRRADEKADQFWHERWRPIIQEGKYLPR